VTTRRRVAITGIGLVTPIGVGRDVSWAAATEGRSGVGRPTLVDGRDLPVGVVGEVADFVVTDHMKKKVAVRTDRNTHFAFAASAEALADAHIDLEQEDKARVGVVLAAHFGGVTYAVDNLARLHRRGPSFISAYMAAAYLPSAAVGQLSIHYGTTGYSKTIVNDAAGGACALGEASRAIATGDCDVVIAGGFEAPLAGAAFPVLATWKEVCTNAKEPEAAFRPFDLDRNGLVIAEGGAILILEELDRARARDAPCYAELAGFAQTTDAVDPSISGTMASSMRAPCVSPSSTLV
jgi:3-oxoacyl-[acyl-carrier-protein] synthase II